MHALFAVSSYCVKIFCNKPVQLAAKETASGGLTKNQRGDKNNRLMAAY